MKLHYNIKEDSEELQELQDQMATAIATTAEIAALTKKRLQALEEKHKAINPLLFWKWIERWNLEISINTDEFNLEVADERKRAAHRLNALLLFALQTNATAFTLDEDEALFLRKFGQ